MRFYTKKHRYYCGIDLNAILGFLHKAIRLADH